jgi:hypothetical protein
LDINVFQHDHPVNPDQFERVDVDRKNPSNGRDFATRDQTLLKELRKLVIEIQRRVGVPEVE